MLVRDWNQFLLKETEGNRTLALLLLMMMMVKKICALHVFFLEISFSLIVMSAVLDV